MVKAVIDIGSSSLKCSIARLEQGKITILDDLNLVTKLGAELAVSGNIGTASMDRNIQALREIQASCARHQVEEVLCVGAETLRKAGDAAIFQDRVHNELGWELRILSSDEEARLSFQASASMAPDDALALVIDSGGGSTEFTFGTGGKIREKHSLPLGAMVLTRRFIHSDPASPDDRAELKRHIGAALQAAFPAPEQALAIACGGSATSLASVSLALPAFDALRIHGLQLAESEIARQVELYASLDNAARQQLIGLRKDRADIILAGAVLLQEILRHFNLAEVTVSTYGLRHALLV